MPLSLCWPPPPLCSPSLGSLLHLLLLLEYGPELVGNGAHRREVGGHLGRVYLAPLLTQLERQHRQGEQLRSGEGKESCVCVCDRKAVHASPA